MNISETDWKLFKTKIVLWQEKYIEKLNREYIAILSQSKPAAEIFRELENRLNSDKRSPGVLLEIKRSNTHRNIALLIKDGVIDFDDLHEFSKEMQDTLRLLIK